MSAGGALLSVLRGIGAEVSSYTSFLSRIDRVKGGGAFGEHAFLPEIALVNKLFVLGGFSILRAGLQQDCPLPDDVCV